MQNIHVKRYKTPNGSWDGWIEPADGSWILFIATEGSPSLYERVERETESGRVNSTYVPAVR